MVLVYVVRLDYFICYISAQEQLVRHFRTTYTCVARLRGKTKQGWTRGYAGGLQAYARSNQILIHIR
jgi:hypothetical protein